MHEVLLEGAAERDLRRLRPEVYQRILNTIVALAQDPRPRNSRKMTGSRRDWRLRIGVWRVIYEVDDDLRAVRIMRVRHRGRAYR